MSFWLIKTIGRSSCSSYCLHPALQAEQHFFALVATWTFQCSPSWSWVMRFITELKKELDEKVQVCKYYRAKGGHKVKYRDLKGALLESLLRIHALVACQQYIDRSSNDYMDLLGSKAKGFPLALLSALLDSDGVCSMGLILYMTRMYWVPDQRPILEAHRKTQSQDTANTAQYLPNMALYLALQQEPSFLGAHRKAPWTGRA